MSFLKGLKNPWRASLCCFFTFFCFCYANLFAEAVSLSSAKRFGSFKPSEIINFVLGSIGIMTLARTFIPSYVPLKRMFPNFLPISTLKSATLSVVHDFFSDYYLFMFIFIFSSTYFLDYRGTDFLFEALIIIFSCQLFKRCLQLMIEYNQQTEAYILFCTQIIIICAVWFLELKFILAFLIFVFFVVGFRLELISLKRDKREIILDSINNIPIELKLILNNKKALIPLIVGVVLKTLVVSINFYFVNFKGRVLIEIPVVYWLFVSPLIIFTYVFNNSWEFWKGVLINYDIRTGEYSNLVKTMIRVISIPIALDLVVTMPIVILSNPNNIIFCIVFYLTSLSILMGFFLIWSTLFPIKVGSYFQMKGNTSFLGYLVSTLLVALLVVITYKKGFYLLVPLYMIITYITFKIGKNLYRNNRKEIFQKIFNN